MSAETDRSRQLVNDLASRLASTGEWRLRQTLVTAIEELDDVAHAAQEKWGGREIGVALPIYCWVLTSKLASFWQ